MFTQALTYDLHTIMGYLLVFAGLAIGGLTWLLWEAHAEYRDLNELYQEVGTQLRQTRASLAEQTQVTRIYMRYLIKIDEMKGYREWISKLLTDPKAPTNDLSKADEVPWEDARVEPDGRLVRDIEKAMSARNQGTPEKIAADAVSSKRSAEAVIALPDESVAVEAT